VADRGADPGEQEPDYRFTLANERTFLAWARTALALLAAGVAVVQLVPQFSVVGARTSVGVVLGLLSVLASAGGVLRWRQVQRAMRRGEPLPPVRVVWLLAAGLAVVAAGVVVLLVVGALR
jgi:putative membrane protein